MSYHGFKIGEEVIGKRDGFKVSGFVIDRPFPPSGTVPVQYEFKDGPVIQYERPEDIRR